MLYAVAAEFYNCSDSALDGYQTKYFKGYILCRNEGAKSACQFDFVYFRHRYIVSASAHSDGYVKSACAESKHSHTSAGRGVAVRAYQCFVRFREAFKVHLMADAVARPRKTQSVFCRNRLYVAVVVGVFKTALQSIVVDISHRKFRFHPFAVHCLEFEISHSSRCVLRESLVYFQTDFFADGHFSAY